MGRRQEPAALLLLLLRVLKCESSERDSTLTSPYPDPFVVSPIGSVEALLARLGFASPSQSQTMPFRSLPCAGAVSSKTTENEQDYLESWWDAHAPLAAVQRGAGFRSLFDILGPLRVPRRSSAGSASCKQRTTGRCSFTKAAVRLADLGGGGADWEGVGGVGCGGDAEKVGFNERQEGEACEGRFPLRGSLPGPHGHALGIRTPVAAAVRGRAKPWNLFGRRTG